MTNYETKENFGDKSVDEVQPSKGLSRLAECMLLAKILNSGCILPSETCLHIPHYFSLNLPVRSLAQDEREKSRCRKATSVQADKTHLRACISDRSSTLPTLGSIRATAQEEEVIRNGLPRKSHQREARQGRHKQSHSRAQHFEAAPSCFIGQPIHLCGRLVGKSDSPGR